MILGLVPARGGSKGVPNKNIRLFHGRPLLAYVAQVAWASKTFDRVVLSTDSKAIAMCGRLYGLEVPFMRSAAVAQDDTPMFDVVVHALAELQHKGWTPDIVVLLQPTSPLRQAKHIHDAIALLQQSKADSVVSVVKIPQHLSPDYVMRMDKGRLQPFLASGSRLIRRQDARPAYARDGTVYALWVKTITLYGTLYGNDCRPLIIDASESLSIDTEADWATAERLLKEV